MLDEGFGAAETRGAGEELESSGECHGLFRVAADLHAEHPAEVAHLARGEGVAGVR